MPILSSVGSRSWSWRTAVLAIYLLLISGSATMLYPFLIMLSSSTANLYDYHDFSPLPRFVWNDTSLFLKTLYLREGGPAAAKMGTPSATLESIKADPEGYVNSAFGEVFARARSRPEAVGAQVADWRRFLQTLPIEFIELHSRDRYLARYPHYVERVYRGRVAGGNHDQALALYNSRAQEQHDTFATVTFWGGQGYPFAKYRPESGETFDLVQDFKRDMGPVFFTFTPTEVLWQAMLQQRYATIADLNAAWGASYGDWTLVEFPLQRPGVAAMAAVWDAFVATRLPLLQQEISQADAASFVRWAGSRLKDAGAPWSDAPADTYRRYPQDPVVGNWWADYVAQQAPAESRTLHTPRSAYVRFLESEYGSLAAAAQRYGQAWTQPADVRLPFAEDLVFSFLQQRGELRWYFLTGNYQRVLEYITTRGRALFNTVVLVALTVLSALTINPLAAYALSRYRLKATPRVLLFMLATTAFPAEVAMIPSFLLLRDLGLLNTFAALVIPGMANGFSIFLLKGFFDSLPQELYEAAELDGAGELRKFLCITLPLSKPILAVMALGAFTFAYTSFMWGLVICPDPQKWTIMVWLFAFQGTHGSSAPYLVMASFVIASLPPLLVFILCQRVILRGIMIPQLK
jgi:multiple sugar transport system permease protein